jgi:hypothetical protein
MQQLQQLLCWCLALLVHAFGSAVCQCWPSADSALRWRIWQRYAATAAALELMLFKWQGANAFGGAVQQLQQHSSCCSSMCLAVR